MSHRVVIVGASDKPERYAHQAMRSLLQHGHQVVLVHPRHSAIDGHPVHASLRDVSGPVHTVTLYVGPTISTTLQADLIALHPSRVIFNPGAENPQLAQHLQQAGIPTENACTLVLLATQAF
jgi:predicted CoA-binding protein